MKNKKVILKFDACRIVEENGKYTLHLSKPTQSSTFQLIDKKYGPLQKLDKEYLTSVLHQKLSFEENKKVQSQGYFFLEDVTFEGLITGLIELIDGLIKTNS